MRITNKNDAQLTISSGEAETSLCASLLIHLGLFALIPRYELDTFIKRIAKITTHRVFRSKYNT